MHSSTLSNLLNTTTSSYLAWSFPADSINQNKSDEVLQKVHLATEKYGNSPMEDTCLTLIKSIGDKENPFAKDLQNSLKDKKCDFSNDKRESNKLLVETYDRLLKEASNLSEETLDRIMDLNRVLFKAKHVTPNLCNKLLEPFSKIERIDRQQVDKQEAKKLINQYLKPSFIKQCKKSLEAEPVYLKHINCMKTILFLFLNFYHEENECQEFVEIYQQRFETLLDIAPEDKKNSYKEQVLASWVSAVGKVQERMSKSGKFIRFNTNAQKALEKQLNIIKRDAILVAKDALKTKKSSVKKTKRSSVNDEKVKTPVTTTEAPITTTKASTTTEVPTTKAPVTTTEVPITTTKTSTTTKVIAASFGVFSALSAFIGWIIFGKKKPQSYIPVSVIETKVNEESIV